MIDDEALAMGLDPVTTRAEGNALARALLDARQMRTRLAAYQAALVERAATLREFSAPSIPGGDLSSHAAEVQRIADELVAMLTEGDHG